MTKHTKKVDDVIREAEEITADLQAFTREIEKEMALLTREINAEYAAAEGELRKLADWVEENAGD